MQPRGLRALLRDLELRLASCNPLRVRSSTVSVAAYIRKLQLAPLLLLACRLSVVVEGSGLEPGAHTQTSVR